MKTIIAFSCLLAVLGCRAQYDGNKPQEGNPVRYEYSYWGMMAQPITFYEVMRDDNGQMIINYCAQSMETVVYKAPEDILERIGALAREHKIHKLQTSYRPDMEILDGYSWHVFVEYEKGYIGSGGSNAWPSDKLWAGIAAINNYIQGIIDAAPEADILDRHPFKR
ncbi:MAG: hypothetical protein IKX67_07535 [Bacteroidales bacterium]|nr:hypothetical protein [Bacteroidales bacterium]